MYERYMAYRQAKEIEYWRHFGTTGSPSLRLIDALQYNILLENVAVQSSARISKEGLSTRECCRAVFVLEGVKGGDNNVFRLCSSVRACYLT